MATNLAQDSAPVLSGGKSEPEIYHYKAEPVLNAVAVLIEGKKLNARHARVHRALAAERDRFTQQLSSVLEQLREANAETERAAQRGMSSTRAFIDSLSDHSRTEAVA